MSKRNAPMQIAAKYPLVKQLRSLLAQSGRLKSKRLLAHIVNPGLCDDVLEYLEPELQAYRGCDIVDIHPGPCLWSQKLHDHLKPRVHLLVENPSSIYQSFINALVQKKGSKYRSFPLDEHKIRELNTKDIFCEGGLPDGERRAAVDWQVNPRLLLTGNFSQSPSKDNFLGLHSLNRILALSHSGTRIHTFGAPKILAWVPSEYTRHYVPRAIRDRNNISLSIDKNGEIAEVCGGGEQGTRSSSSRFWELESNSRKAALKRMADARIALPGGRSYEKVPEDLLVPNTMIDDYLLAGGKGTKHVRSAPRQGPLLHISEIGPIHWNWPNINAKVTAFTELERIIKRAEKSINEGSGAIPTATLIKLKNKYSVVRKDARYYIRLKIVIGNFVLAIEALRAYKNELHLRGVDFNACEFEDDYSAECARLAELRDQVRLLEPQIDAHALAQAESLIDERFVAARKDSFGPPLAWDRRPYEPFLTSADEFFPAHNLSLISFTPKIMAPDIYAGESGGHWWHVVSRIFGRPRTALPQALDSLMPGAADYLIPRVPEIRDPTQGGLADPGDFPVRCLTSNMLAKLATEWGASQLKAQVADTLIAENHEDNFS